MHLPRRRRKIQRIEERIEALRERAAALLEHQRSEERRLEELRARPPAPGWLRRARLDRASGHAQEQLERLRRQRELLVEREIRSIMLALREQSSRTRERLDRELERIAPVEHEWERLRAMFQFLEEAISTPAVSDLAQRWQGGLSIPDFPLVEDNAYVKPFPPQAILF